MNYSDYLQIDNRYQSSINLEYDITDREKICSYIPTKESVRIIKQYLYALVHEEKDWYANILIGPYGKGKSHLILVLMALLAYDTLFDNDNSRLEYRNDIEILIRRLESVDKETADLARTVLEKNGRLLPVIINSNSVEINQVLIQAIQKALDRAGLSRLTPKTSFSAAANMIETWQEKYPDTYSALNKQLSHWKKTAEDLKDELYSNNRKAYKLFIEIYPALTSGSSFVPDYTDDAIQYIQAVNETLVSQTQFNGLFIVYDEFSKFIEGNLEKANMPNYKVIQELAELATRSDASKTIIFSCITHKDFLDYSDSETIRTVEGRFKKLWYIQTAAQSYELIANTIEKKDKFIGFIKENEQFFAELKEQVCSIGLFPDIQEDAVLKTIIYGCFPLAPVTAYALLRISEKAAQNERTLFTFLASNDINSVATYINEPHKKLELITIDRIYDYFSDAFENNVQDKRMHSIWIKSRTALQLAKGDDQKRVIKALAIIQMIDDVQLYATILHCKTALLLEETRVNEAFQQLCSNHIISRRESTGEYVFLTANGVDIKRSIEQFIATKLPTINTIEILTDIADPGFVLPRQYNDTYKIIRYFKRIYISSDTFLSYGDASTLHRDYPYDGLIIEIIATGDSDSENCLEHYKEICSGDKSVILVLSLEPFSLERQLKEVVAINAIKTSEIVHNDKHYEEELLVYEEDLIRFIQNKISEQYNVTNPMCQYYVGEAKEDIYKDSQLSKLISDICFNLYQETPRINNEMINRTELSSPIRKARSIVVDHIIHSSSIEEIVIDGFGPEVSIFNATVKNKNISGLLSNDEGLSKVLQAISEFSNHAAGKRACFSELYSILLSKPIAVRKGVIPIYIAYVLSRLPGIATIYWDDYELPLSATALEKVNNQPGKAWLFVDKLTVEKQKYLTSLGKLFADSESADVRTIVVGMQKWSRGLPRVTKEALKEYKYENCSVIANDIDYETIRFRHELQKYDINVREFVLESLPEIYGTKDYSELADHIKSSKDKSDTYLRRIRNTLIDFTRDAIYRGYNGSLVQAMKLWKERNRINEIGHIVDTVTMKVWHILTQEKSNDDDHIINQLAIAVEGLSIEDWSDQSVSSYIVKLPETLDKILCSDEEPEDNGETVSFSFDLDNQKISRRLSAKPISAVGRTLKNNLRFTLDEYGDSITQEEKIIILLDLMQSLTGEKK